MNLRDLPSVDELLRDERLASEPHELVVAAARRVLDEVRDEVRAGTDPGPLVDRIAAELAQARRSSLRRVLNATGVLVHTNLGRAPLADAALARVAEVGAGYSNLEYDLEAGERGSRQDHLAAVLRRLTGADAALVVNNNAAAVLLALAALAEGREVVVSRGELIEIGDGFRIPDVLARSGARLVEVGTTNRTRAADYECAIGPETAVLLRVHQSNFRVLGFTERPELGELAAIAKRTGIPLVDDLGSGALARLGDEPTPAESVRAGADLVCFSGDKLLGGPQAGIVVGRADLVERLRRHPLQRALRADKLTLAALEGTLQLALDPATRDDVPVLRMLHEPIESVRARAERLAQLVGGEVEETVARVGGGALPLAELPSAACAVEESLAEPLRHGDPPVVALVRDGRTLLDCRTLTDAEVDEVASAIDACRRRPSDTVSRGVLNVVELKSPDERSRLCERVLGDLPEWFGIEAANAAYIRDVAELPTFAVDGDAILSLKLHTPGAAEVYLIAVRKELHGRGVGTALLAAAEAYLRAGGIEYLQVKTLGPSDPDPGYARTRAFYEARGFVPLEELHGLWEDNPCLLLVKRL